MGNDKTHVVRSASPSTAIDNMRPERLKALLEEVRSGSLTVAKASEELTSVLRQAPFEDLGFAKVDHHRAIRQGFPEVVFGNGKTA